MVSENEFLFKKDKKKWYLFTEPVEIICEYSDENINEKLEYINLKAEQGFHAAGFLSYEASCAFDPKFSVKKNNISPILWFGIYKNKEEVDHDSLFKTDSKTHELEFDLNWELPLSRDEYSKNISKIRKAISEGDIYQMNYTFLMESRFPYNPFSFFSSVFSNLDSPYMAFVETENFAVLSSSPELFFSLKDGKFVSKPMKGTIERGRTVKEDMEKKAILSSSLKDQAENVMIVDMIRNDIGKIAKPLSVQVEKLFNIEKYDRVFQMTTTVKADVLAPFHEVLRVMFPCASITGAPKMRSMEYIEKLEKRERGLYTGAIGYVSEGESLFNVAIRTVFLNKEEKKAYYGTGGGIVFDSSAENEFEECRNKALVVQNAEKDFKLLETMLYLPGNGFFLYDLHMERLLSSIDYFSFDLNKDELSRELKRFYSKSFARVRLLYDRFGNIEIQQFKMDENPLSLTPLASSLEWKVGISEKRVDSNNRFLFHKTTNRKIYEDALADNEGHDDILLINEEGELTESCFANIVVEKNGKYFTPFTDSGLLNGTMRQYLINQGILLEKRMTMEDIYDADSLWLLNSVRGWIKALL